MFKKILFSIAVFSLVALPMITAAQTSTGGTVDSYGAAQDLQLQSMVEKIIGWALGILVLVSVAMIIYGGFKMVTSGGDSEKFGQGQQMVLYAIIGLIVAFLAWAIVNFVLGSVLNVGAGT